MVSGGGVWWWPGGQLSRAETTAILPVRLPLLVRHPERRHIISPEFVCMFFSFSWHGSLGRFGGGVCVSDEGLDTLTPTGRLKEGEGRVLGSLPELCCALLSGSLRGRYGTGCVVSDGPLPSIRQLGSGILSLWL